MNSVTLIVEEPIEDSMQSEEDMERTIAKTYVPRYQKEIWKENADDLDMSQSEFIRCMVQAGRRGFDLDSSEDTSSGSDPRGNTLKRTVLSLIEEEPHTWEELQSAVTNDIEEQLDETLQELQQQNEIQYSGRQGGYEKL